MPILGGDEQRCRPISQGLVRRSSLLEQEINDVVLASLCGDEKGRHTIIRGMSGVGFMLKQEGHDVAIAVELIQAAFSDHGSGAVGGQVQERHFFVQLLPTDQIQHISLFIHMVVVRIDQPDLRLLIQSGRQHQQGVVAEADAHAHHRAEEAHVLDGAPQAVAPGPVGPQGDHLGPQVPLDVVLDRGPVRFEPIATTCDDTSERTPGVNGS